MSDIKKNQKKYALISVYDKTGVVDLARTFVEKGFEIISTGGTAELLEKNNIKTIPIENITNSPESFDGRVKTISFHIASALLFDRSKKSHVKDAQKLNIPNIEIVVCNFYPFAEKLDIEMIDIGGPTIVRASAKNYESQTVIVDAGDYQKIINELNNSNNISLERRQKLAAKAFAYVAGYDKLISDYFSKKDKQYIYFLSLKNGKRLRYGENPHQSASFFANGTTDPLGLGNYLVLQGKETSFNNYLDLDAGIQTISLIGQKDPACVILKHTNPCGAATASTIETAFERAWFDGDPLAAFGGVIIFNRFVTEKLAALMVKDKKFFEIIAAPGFENGALKIFATRPKLQLLQNKFLMHPSIAEYKDLKRIRGGYLLQDFDTHTLQKKHLKVVTKEKPTEEQIEDLLFAWKISQVSKSNCVVAVKNKTLLSSGVGQQDRKRCCELCVSKAIKPLTGATAATDGFFPFRDGPDILIKAGIKAIIQPGGSIRDQETINACNEHGVTMIMTGIRAFKH